MAEEADQAMPDAPQTGTEEGTGQALGGAGEEQVEAGEEVFGNGEQRVRLLPGYTESAASFEFEKEDHTLGNALRYMIMKNPEVEFCGYSIPHPSEAKMNVRIQTYEPYTAMAALERGLDDLMDLCDVIQEKFTVARDEFNRERQNGT